MNDSLKSREGTFGFGSITQRPRLEYANPFQRFFSMMMDSAIASIIFFLFAGKPHIATTTHEVLGQTFVDQELAFDLPMFYMTIFFLVLRILFEASPLHASPGKLLFFLEAQNEDREPLGIMGAVFRNILYIIIPFTSIFYFFSKKKQCLHDKWAGSIVVKKSHFSDVIFFPAMIFSLALTAIIVYKWVNIAYSLKEQIQEMQGIQNAEVPAISKEEALAAAIIPDDDKLGSIMINGETTELETVYARVRDNIKLTSFGEFKKNGQILEIAFYAENINDKALKRFDGVIDLMKDSKNKPLALLSLHSDDLEKKCNEIAFGDSELIIDASAFNTAARKDYIIKINPGELRLNSTLIMNCDLIKAGNELFLSLQTKFTSDEINDGLINVRFTSKLNKLTYLGNYILRHSDPNLALAVFNKQQRILKVAFYEETFSKEALNTAYVKGILPTSPQPKLLLDIPITGQLFGSGKDIIKKGYTITFKNLPSEIGKALAHHDFQIKYDAGEVPARFVIQSPHAPQIQGRLEGQKAINSAGGISELAWSISINSRLILIKR